MLLKYALVVLALFSTTLFAIAQQKAKAPATPNWGIAIHGGAGTILKKNMTPEKEKAYNDKMQEALLAGHAVLEKGGTSLEAIEACIHILEDSPLFNAGKGSVFTNEGKNEMDAAVMDGSNLKAGSVAGLTTVRHPISAALAVMNQSEHVMMIGAGAEQFAASKGLEIVDPSYFRDETRYQQLQRIKDKEKTQLDHDGSQGMSYPEQAEDDTDKKFGTVGAVALDKHGNLAAGTSTGGMTNKRFGRVGDVPIIGAGTYANNATCAVSATGWGEYFIRYVVAYDISALMEYKGMSLKAASEKVILEKLEKAQKETGGVIAIDRKGNISMPFNSAGMYRGFIKADGKPQTFIYKD
jgi:L-asparaginase / beta-aspartyl-peptidase